MEGGTGTAPSQGADRAKSQDELLSVARGDLDGARTRLSNARVSLESVEEKEMAIGLGIDYPGSAS